MSATELSLPEIKVTAFAILKHFQDFCRNNNIQFYLSNGTLLGAVKYRAFIPWDDDIDVFVPREDYDRLIRLYDDSNRYRLFSHEREASYKFPFAKLCDMTTRKEENNVDNGVLLGIDIDIFPLDFCSKSILTPNIQRKLRIYQKGCILSKFISSKGKSLYKRFAIGCCKFFGFEFFYNKLTETIERERAKGSEYMGCLMWPIYGKREIIPAEVFSNVIEVEFEGENFPAPAGYDVYLRSLYGDYQKDPAPEQQKSHHQYKAYHIE